jgi:hypothetical protein
MLSSAQCRVVDVSASRASVSTTFTRALAMEAVVVDVGSLPVEHAMSHIPPLHVSGMRPLATDDDNPMSVCIPVDGTLMSVQTVCDAAEWVGQAVQTHV